MAEEEKKEPQSYARRDFLLGIEKEAVEYWDKIRVFEEDAPVSEDEQCEKYFCTFPYPYANGRLHLGHCFTLSKADIQCNYQRLLGKKAIWPFGFHCTGMPIKASADKLKEEIEAYGNPPRFPGPPHYGEPCLTIEELQKRQNAFKEEQKAAEEEEKAAKAAAKRAAGGKGKAAADADATAAAAAATAAANALEPGATKGHAKKTKLLSKKGMQVFQWDILLSSGVESSEIAKFQDATHWLGYFPPFGESDLRLYGAAIDWRRTFITTDTNPFYDSFVRWQFNTLKEQGRIRFGKRHSIYSPKDGQPCADHDRASGEGVAPQEYTIVKLRVLDPMPLTLADVATMKSCGGCGATTTTKRCSRCKACYCSLECQRTHWSTHKRWCGTASVRSARSIFLVPATLRPETMYGQTNCFVLPTGDYGCYDVGNNEVFVMSDSAARNLAFQGFSASGREGEVRLLARITGQELIGTPLKAPLSSFERIYTLPMVTISMEKATGVVTSVPSDAPDDWAALMDLRNKPDLRAKFNVKDEWVLPFEPVSIIRTSEFGDLSAKKACELFKVTSQNQRVELAEAKDKVYKAGFYDGVFLVGKYKGEAVKDAKLKVRQLMVDENEAIEYWEPASKVVSRSGDECVVALTDQWYIDYGNPAWTEEVAAHVRDTLDTYEEDLRQMLLRTIDWLREWACSRSFGLGTRLPWDPQYLIESLSDSTIYMAYYTIAHLLQAGNLDPNKVVMGDAQLRPEQCTHEFWDYVFYGKGDKTAVPGGAPADVLDRLRHEFLYWYPWDLRVSGKDLAYNHLPFSLYNHVALFPKQHWPRSIKCGGFLEVNAEKMSKSKGNFFTIYDAVQKFSATALRFALADAGDTLETANFEEKAANMAAVRLYTVLQQMKEFVANAAAAGVTSVVNDDETTMLARVAADSAAPFADRAFANQMRAAIVNANVGYSRMVYRDALKAAFFELQIHKDQYILVTSTTGAVNHSLLLRYCQLQVLLVSPIVPQWSEHAWREVLKQQDTSILRQRWPRCDSFDPLLLRQAAHLHSVVHQLRKKVEMSDAMATKKKLPLVSTAPAGARLWVCDSYTSLQRDLLDTIRPHFDDKTREFKLSDKELMERIRSVPSLAADLALKKKGKAMAFFGYVRGLAKESGVEALSSELPFDEKAMLDEVHDYVRGALPVVKLEIVASDDADDFKKGRPFNPALEFLKE